MHTHIRIPDRLERLIMVLSIALHWAVSTGMMHEKLHQDHGEKRGLKKQVDPISRFLKGVYAFCEDSLSSLQHSSLYGII